MSKIKRISVNFSDVERAELDNNKSEYTLSRTVDNIYKLLFEFKKENRQTDLKLTIKNIEEGYTTFSDSYSGVKGFNYYYFLDKIISVDLGGEEPKLLIKLNAYEKEKESFNDSIYVSKIIDKLGKIYLHNHIAYTDFTDNTELIELCIKYAQFCSKCNRDSEDMECLLDKTIKEIESDFQHKLEYYGYNTEAKIKEIKDTEIKDISYKKTNNIEEIVNKIILLTQCLFYQKKSNNVCYYLINGIMTEANNYTKLI